MPERSGAGPPSERSSSQCCRRSRRASERPPPRKGPENRGRATEARRTRPRRVFLTSREAQSRHGHGQRAGWWEGADLGVAAHARGEADTVSKKRQDIFCFGRDMEWHGKEGGRGDASSSTKANPSRYEKFRFSTLSVCESRQDTCFHKCLFEIFWSDPRCIVASISACHAEDPGSIPGRGVAACTKEDFSITMSRQELS